MNFCKKLILSSLKTSAPQTPKKAQKDDAENAKKIFKNQILAF